jgi:hypothetical protein
VASKREWKRRIAVFLASQFDEHPGFLAVQCDGDQDELRMTAAIDEVRAEMHRRAKLGHWTDEPGIFDQAWEKRLKDEGY